MRATAYLVLSFVFSSPGFAADELRDSQTDDIRETVFRWQFDHNLSGLKKKAPVYFLGVAENRGDPTDEFLKRFADHNPPVRKRSACRIDGIDVRDTKTGERGLIFQIRKIEWKSDTEVEVRGGYYEGGKSSSGNTYTVKKENRKWRVAKDQINSYS